MQPSPEKIRYKPLFGLLLGAGLMIMLVVLVFSTYDRINRSGEIMNRCIARQGEVLVQSLEGAIRAGMRQGRWQITLLRTLSQEMAHNDGVISIAIFGERGELLAWGGKEGSMSEKSDPLAGLPITVTDAAARRQNTSKVMGEMIVMGRRLEPIGRFMMGRQKPPDWACDLSGDAPYRVDRGRYNNRFPGEHGGNAPRISGYALVRFSLERFAQARSRDIQQAVLLGILMFAGATSLWFGVLFVTQKRASEIESLRNQISETRYMASFGRLAASIAHEVRNPLSSLRGLVQLLAKKVDKDSREQEYASVAVAEIDRLGKIVSSLLAYTDRHKPIIHKINLKELVEVALNNFSGDPRLSYIQIETKHAKPDINVVGDYQALNNVLNIVIDNALDSLNGHGSLSIRTGNFVDSYSVEIADTGQGISLEILSQTFEPFFSTKERGAGLGLAIAKRIMTEHKGEINARNREDGGAIFTLIFPKG